MTEPTSSSSKPHTATMELPHQSYNQSKGRGFTGWHMLIVLLAFFLTILTVNLTMVYFSRSSWTGLNVKNSYVASQEFNHRVELQERLLAAGWQAELVTRDGLRYFEIRQHGATLGQCKVILDATQPMNTAGDVKLDLTVDKTGSYPLPRQFMAGRWDLSFHGDCPGAEGLLQRGYRLRDGQVLPYRSASRLPGAK